MKVLIAEDDAFLREILEKNVSSWGYNVIVTADGNEAWDVLSRYDTPEIAILDWKMPGIDGIELCKLIRKLDNDIFIYLIICSSMGAPEDLTTGFEAGADDYVVKTRGMIELKVRLQAAERIVNLESFLRGKIREMEQISVKYEELQRQMAISNKNNIMNIS